MKVKNINISNDKPKIVVIGSSSLDWVINTERTPLPSETILATSSENYYGGKGANQAVGCARLGAQVHFIGSVGMEPVGQQILRHLVDEGVNVGFVNESPYSESGKAYVLAAENQNTIVVVPAANNDLKKTHITQAEKVIEKADWILIQMEIPIEVIFFTIQYAFKHKIKIGLYASPAKKLPEEIIDKVNFIVAKESDLSTIFGENHTLETLLRRYPNQLFVRNNSNGTYFFDQEKILKIEQETPTHTLHKMGMGDAFTAGLTIALAHQNSIEQSVKFGNEIANEVSKQRGSQRGLPKLQDLI